MMEDYGYGDWKPAKPHRKLLLFVRHKGEWYYRESILVHSYQKPLVEIRLAYDIYLEISGHHKSALEMTIQMWDYNPTTVYRALSKFEEN